MNNYILCRWRDAITDPPEDGVVVTLKKQSDDSASSTLHIAFVRWGRWLLAEGENKETVVCVGDQWLDITTAPGVPREAVQAAVDEMSRARSAEKLLSEESTNAEDKIHHRACEISFNHAAIYVAKHTGVTPSEVQ